MIADFLSRKQKSKGYLFWKIFSGAKKSLEHLFWVRARETNWLWRDAWEVEGWMGGGLRTCVW